MEDWVGRTICWGYSLSETTLCFVGLTGLATVIVAVTYCVYQYKAHHCQWALHVVCWLAVGLIVCGLGASLCWVLGLVYMLAFILCTLIWYTSKKMHGWQCHLFRSTICAALCSVWLSYGATESAQLEFLVTDPSLQHLADDWLAHDFPGRMVFMLPGLLWVAVIVAGVSYWSRNGMAGTWRSLLWQAFFVIWSTICLLGANWYVAGRIDVFQAIQSGRICCVRYTIWSRPGTVGLVKLYGARTVLHVAASSGKTEMLRLLLEAGADVNARTSPDASARTPLHNAAYRGQVDAVRILVNSGADINAQALRGNTPLHDALWAQRREASKQLLV